MSFRIHTFECKNILNSKCDYKLNSGILLTRYNKDDNKNKNEEIFIKCKSKNLYTLYHNVLLDEYIERGIEIHPCSSMLGKTISKNNAKIVLKNAGICIFGNPDKLDIICENFKETLEFKTLININVSNLKRYNQRNKMGDHTLLMSNQKQFKNTVKKLKLNYTLIGQKKNYYTKEAENKFGFSFGKLNIRETPIISSLRELKEEFGIDLDRQLFEDNNFILYEDEGRILYGIDISTLL